ncbi:MAG: insulinase family protein [Treponema sp.]|jgi:Zn-dependent M16 (insulinase) family peptidase|nr:insulinase family protein [Treponema sp.]
MIKTELRQGQTLESGFQILAVKELGEFEACGIWARHIKSGTEVFHVHNNDSENLFSFAFATPPKDSTGAAHILEHSVLCGSENYPLKDAFLVLAQGSLQTFLNAWTFPDKTVYPASSVNEQDYFNLMSVYGDAVFRPTLSEWTFMQEGHRLSFADGVSTGVTDSNSVSPKQLEITGVVYNEMKGAYSALDAYTGLWSVKAVLPNTPYDFESGGDPEHIPNLTWDGLKQFHRDYYSPANCRIFLAGNITTEKQLDFLNDNFLSALDAGNKCDAISLTPRWEKPKSYNVPCPAGADQKPTVLVSWLCGDSSDMDESLNLAALTEVLMGHDGSPLTRALIESGLGEDLSPASGLEGELRETSLCVGLRGLAVENSTDENSVAEAAEKVQALILQTLERLAEDGIPKEEIEAALLGMEFSHREIRRSGGPFSLVWMRRSLRAWLHGGTPWDSLLFTPALDSLKRRIAGEDRYFENLIRRYLLDNPHRALIIIKPTEGFQEEKEAALHSRLLEIDSSLGEEERQVIAEKNEELKVQQEKENSPEALASIPHLSRSDLKAEIETVKREYDDASGVPALVNPIFTNGISYVNLAFPADVFPPEDYPWFPFFAKAIVSAGLPGMDYGEVSTFMARTVGGLNTMLQTGSPVPDSARIPASPESPLFSAGGALGDVVGRDWIIFRLKMLDEKIAASLDLSHKLITSADFSDLKRLRDLALEMKNDLDSNMAPAGHMYASSRCSRLFSRSRCVEDLWSGIDQILFAHKLVTLDASEICDKLKALQSRLLGAGLLLNVAGGAHAEVLKEAGKRFGGFGAPAPRNPQASKIERFTALSAFGAAAGKGEVFASPSLQVGFAAATLKAAPFASPQQAADLVVSHQLSTGALWENIRMKGGAYGAFATPDSLEGIFSLATYRDPNPLRSLEAFSSILKEAAEGKPSLDDAAAEAALTKVVIGTYARETSPRSPAGKSLADFLRFLYGIDDSHRLRRLKNLVAVNEAEVSAVFKRLAEDADNANAVIIAGKAEAEKAAALLGMELRQLPV